MPRDAADPYDLETLRGRALARLVPPLLHDARNYSLPVRVALELSAHGGAVSTPEVLLSYFDRSTAVLNALSRFASGSYGDDSVSLGAWTEELGLFARPLCAQHGIEHSIESRSDGVVRPGPWPTLVAFLVVLAEHAELDAGAVRVRSRAGPRSSSALLVLEDPRADVVALAESLVGPDSFALRHCGKTIVLRAAFSGARGATPAAESAARARVLVVEPVDPFGALTVDVLRDAGHEVVAATPEGIEHALEATFDLVLFDRRLESTHPGARAQLVALSTPVALLGEGGLPVPFDPRELIDFVDRVLALPH